MLISYVNYNIINNWIIIAVCCSTAPGQRVFVLRWFILSLLSPHYGRLTDYLFANVMKCYTFYHKLQTTQLVKEGSVQTILMNFTRKSNFSSIIVTKKIYHGRSAKARRYSIPLNSIDNTIRLTNGWRLADTKLHIFRFEITRNILINKTRNIPAGSTETTEELLPNS